MQSAYLPSVTVSDFVRVATPAFAYSSEYCHMTVVYRTFLFCTCTLEYNCALLFLFKQTGTYDQANTFHQNLTTHYR